MAAAALLAAARALAQPAQSAQPTEPTVRAQIDLGFVSAAGNSDTRTLNAGEQFAFRPAPWRFSQSFSVVNGSTDRVETVNTLKAGLRADYAVGSRFSVYALFNFERNRFAGIDRRFEEAAGLAYGVLTRPRHQLDVEAGVGRNQQRGLSGPVQQFWASRLAARYRFSFTSAAYVEEKLSLLSDLERTEDELLTSETSVVAPISAKIGLRLGYSLRFANLPQPGFKKTDTVLSAGLQLVL
jgi:putative salt-induced outer membrane protein